MDILIEFVMLSGYTVIVTSNCFLALGFAGYSVRSIMCCRKRENPYKLGHRASHLLSADTSVSSGSSSQRSCCEWMGSIAPAANGVVALSLIVFTVFIYERCKSLTVVMTVISGVWSVNNLKLRLGKGIFVYISVGITAVIIGGVLTAVMNWVCLQWMHIIIASCFAIQGAAIALAVKNFEIIGYGKGDESTESRVNYVTVNDSI